MEFISFGITGRISRYVNNIYIFTEGCLGKSQDQFWRLVNRYVYKDSLRIVACDGIGNVAYKIGELAVFNNYIDNTDIIIIDIDDVEENKAVNYSVDKLKQRIGGAEPWVYRTTQGIRKELRSLDNAFILGLICFEDTVLRFNELTKWMYSLYDRETSNRINYLLNVHREYIDELKKREIACNCYAWKSNKTLADFYKLCTKQDNLDACSIEVFADLLLATMTKSTKGHFRTTKAEFGVCFSTECKSKGCYLAQIKSRGGKIDRTKACGLYYSCEKLKRKTTEQKILALYKNTSLYRELRNCKIELLRRGYNIAYNIRV